MDFSTDFWKMLVAIIVRTLAITLATGILGKQLPYWLQKTSDFKLCILIPETIRYKKAEYLYNLLKMTVYQHIVLFLVSSEATL